MHRVRLRPLHDFRMRGEPHIAASVRVTDQFLDDPDAGAVADHVRMHGELKQTAFLISRVELAAENIEHVGRWRVRPV